MKESRVPTLVGRDTVAAWQAVFIPELATDAERSQVVSVGAPAGYWQPQVGLPGQWRWPNGAVTNVSRSPVLLQREPGGAYLLSEDAGFTWRPLAADIVDRSVGIFPLVSDALRAQARDLPSEPAKGGSLWPMVAAVGIIAVALNIFSLTVTQKPRR